ncbi:D-alanine--D-alanine ligase family protein [Streptomyces mirabilis]|uniref:D-alanine--D-alanine ligase family protein n=1 Tax=Streptomyces mirabilis TaxID=68239 RepID=UPI0033323896
MSRVESAEDLPEALMACFAYHDEALIERRVTGTEIAVGVADLGDGPRALPAVEIVTDGLYDYTARYTPGAVTFHCPARLPDQVAQEAARVAVSAHQALGLLDLSRTDTIVTPAGEVAVPETNVAPGVTETSTYPMALSEAATTSASSAAISRPKPPAGTADLADDTRRPPRPLKCGRGSRRACHRACTGESAASTRLAAPRKSRGPCPRETGAAP